MDFGPPVFLSLLVIRCAAHRAARIAAKLAECAIRAGVLLRHFLIHTIFYIFLLLSVMPRVTVRTMTNALKGRPIGL